MADHRRGVRVWPFREIDDNRRMTRRAVGDPWYTVLYREPARWWWMQPITNGLAGGAGVWLLSRSLLLSIGYMLSAVVIGLPLTFRRRRRPVQIGQPPKRPPNRPLSRPGDPY